MGLDIAKITFMEVVDVLTSYCKIRNIVLSKRDATGVFTICYEAIFTKDDKEFIRRCYSTEQAEIYENPWLSAYTNLRENLTKEGIQYTDKI